MNRAKNDLLKKLFPVFIVFFLFSTAFPVFLVASEPSQEKVQITEINLVRYEATLASSAQLPKDYMKIPFGSKDQEVGGTDQDPEHFTNGIPSAFFPQSDGSVWILDSVNSSLKLFNSAGKFVSKIPLELSSSKNKILIKDFSVVHPDEFYVYSDLDGLVKRIASNGKTIVEIEGLNSSLSIGTDPKGNVLVKNPALTGVLRFNPAGEIIEQYTNQYNLSTYCDTNGNPYGIKGDNDQIAILYKATNASPVKEITMASFSLEFPIEKNIHIVNREILGTDQQGNIYIELVACDDPGIIHLNRFYKLSPEGQTLATLNFLTPPSVISPDLPRHMVVTGDGKIMTFTVDSTSYGLVTYSF
ncbi:MAG: hypothetical protein HQM08_22255 [Candidatus Riflebacteria bacterium]|nr:hypothetical protein [Candidatus Riflebacteria bacterium]